MASLPVSLAYLSEPHLHEKKCVYLQQTGYVKNVLFFQKRLGIIIMVSEYFPQKRLNLYGRKLVGLPVPELVMFYNGTEEADDRILRLSDAFAREGNPAETDIEVRVRMININYGKNKSLLSSCRPLEEYAWLVAQIRENQRFMGIEDAAEKAARYAGMTEEQFLSYRK